MKINMNKPMNKIDKLFAEIAGIVARQNELRKAIDDIVADLEGSR